jgi:hypothetical protein
MNAEFSNRKVQHGQTAMHCHQFSSLRNMVLAIDATPRRWRKESSRNNDARHSWDLNAGYTGALAMARDGWKEGASNLAQSLAKLPMRDKAPERSYGIAGAYPNVARYMGSGNPKSMVVLAKPDKDKGKALCLVVDVCVSASTDAECMSRYGLAIANYVRDMERQGVRCKVIAACATQEGDQGAAIAWTVKEQGAPINMSDLAFSIGHPAAFRRLAFAVYERSTCKQMGGYGRIIPMQPEYLTGLPKETIFLRGMNQANATCRTVSDATAALAAEIERQRGKRG